MVTRCSGSAVGNRSVSVPSNAPGPVGWVRRSRPTGFCHPRESGDLTGSSRGPRLRGDDRGRGDDRWQRAASASPCFAQGPSRNASQSGCGPIRARTKSMNARDRAGGLAGRQAGAGRGRFRRRPGRRRRRFRHALGAPRAGLHRHHRGRIHRRRWADVRRRRRHRRGSDRGTGRLIPGFTGVNPAPRPASPPNHRSRTGIIGGWAGRRGAEPSGQKTPKAGPAGPAFPTLAGAFSPSGWSDCR